MDRITEIVKDNVKGCSGCKYLYGVIDMDLKYEDKFFCINQNAVREKFRTNENGYFYDRIKSNKAMKITSDDRDNRECDWVDETFPDGYFENKGVK